jgi:hypothetical protein
MQHPVQVHIDALELLMLELSFRFSHETDRACRVQLSDRIHSLNWALKCYRIGLEVEDKAVGSNNRPDAT